jgi:hypothetical protein
MYCFGGVPILGAAMQIIEWLAGPGWLCPSPRPLQAQAVGATFCLCTTGTIETNLSILAGGSAAAAGTLVNQLGGDLMGYLFILEIPFLKGREKLGGLPRVTLLETDE